MDGELTGVNALLRAEKLCKSFGGVTATDAVSLDILEGETHALIGPNGAGKTTLVAQLSGLLQPDSGRIFFDKRDITRLPAHRRTHVGLGRSFQISSVFMGMTVVENVSLGVQAMLGHSFRFWRPAREMSELRKPALEHLDTVGLADRSEVRASSLSHGERRQLEIAMALTAKPKLLLLDEPMAGLGPEETKQMIATLRALKGVTMLLVEHDMDAVFALADRISVLVYGRTIATGAPDEIRSNRGVIQAYLGESDECFE
ncbi:MAG: ABC transporter ATP-binding protein [Hyphomicrobiaceae bacterium]